MLYTILWQIAEFGFPLVGAGLFLVGGMWFCKPDNKFVEEFRRNSWPADDPEHPYLRPSDRVRKKP